MNDRKAYWTQIVTIAFRELARGIAALPVSEFGGEYGRNQELAAIPLRAAKMADLLLAELDERYPDKT